MEYIKVDCYLTPDTEINREIIIAELGALGFESFDEKEDHFEAFIPSKDFNNEILKAPELTQNQLCTIRFEQTIIPDQNWNEEWEKNYFKPLLVEEECLVRAPFHHDYPKARYEIIIEPNMAFGTGNHETTYLMISEILQQDLTDKVVLDMGCGTGILGILASMRGAKEIMGIDIDEWAYKGTLDNAQLNNIQNLRAQQGDADSLGNQKYDIIFANIQRNVLLNDMAKYVSVLNPGGEILMSGFYKEDLDVISRKAESIGLQLTAVREKKNWVVAKFKL